LDLCLSTSLSGKKKGGRGERGWREKKGKRPRILLDCTYISQVRRKEKKEGKEKGRACFQIIPTRRDISRSD